MGNPVNLFGQPQQQQRPSFIDTLLGNVLQGLQIGQTIKTANRESELRQQQIEQNKLQMELLKHNLTGAQLQEKLAPLQAQLEIAKLLQGLPGQQTSTTINPANVPVQGMANVPESLGGPGGYQPSQGLTTNFGLQPASYQTEMPQAPVNVDLSAAFPGRGSMSIPIQTQQQQRAQTLQDLLLRGNIDARAAGAKAGAEQAAKLAATPPINIPAGIIPGFQGGAVDERALPVVTAGMTQAGENARTDKTIKSNQTVAGMNLAATQEQRKFEQANKLSDDFRTDTKDFAVIDDAYAKIKAGAQLQTGAGDVALLYGYMKLLDPNSAVREGEVATAQNTQGIPQRVIAAYNKAAAGESLAPAARANFVQAAQKTYESVQPRLKMIEGRYQDKAKKAGLDPKQFTFQGQGSKPLAAGAVDPNAKAKFSLPAEGQTVQTPDGRTWKRVGRDMVPVS